ncbi:MAG: Anti-sigma-I factor RsgI [Pelotomaculum sp. PtaU1.Bin035]|nr:MAG: Anti-sigma-I factor RsgI [Pelotomaculum sp. PtaU1.Bin035]
MKTTGMVVKTIGNSCILLTNEGEYKKVPLPVDGEIRVGQIIVQEGRKKRFTFLRYFTVAACLLLIILTGQLYLGRTQPAAAFVTIDINPSIELAVLSDKKVASARGLNSDGVAILEEVKVKGLDLHEAVELIVAQAVADQFLNIKEDNVILVTLTTDNNGKPVVDLESIYESIKSPVELNGLDTEVIIEPVETAVRQEAEKAGISTGRYLLLQKTAKRGIDVCAGEINAMSLEKFEKDKKISVAELLSENGGDDSSGDKDKEVEKAVKKGIYKKQHNSKENDDNKKAGYYTGIERTDTDNGKMAANEYIEKKDIEKKGMEKKKDGPEHSGNKQKNQK